eukprot:Colp12_sorted_trinity150504_noHs@8631
MSLPMFAKPHPGYDEYDRVGGKKAGGIATRFRMYLRGIMEDKDSKNLFMFLCINLSFTFVELFYGWWCNSLGLISDGFHMLFDCTALVAGLVASIISKWPANDKYTYGFVNGLFLVFIAFFVFTESVERVMEPPEVHTDRLFIVSFLGFCVNLVGIYVFNHGGSHGHSHGGGDDHGHSHGGKNQIMEGVFLHILADTLGSVGVMISSLLMQQFGWMMADPLCSMAIAIMIFLSVIPLLRSSTGILLQRTPKGCEDRLTSSFQQLSSIEGVRDYSDAHFWTLSSKWRVGSITVRAGPDADIARILHNVHKIFKQAGINKLTVQVEPYAYSLQQQQQQQFAYGAQTSHPGGMHDYHGHGEHDHDHHDDHHGHSHSGGHGHSHTGGHGHSHAGGHGHSHSH